jgi:hypothetical protein
LASTEPIPNNPRARPKDGTEHLQKEAEEITSKDEKKETTKKEEPGQVSAAQRVISFEELKRRRNQT